MSYLIDICFDEIALEGLDGITLACLWCRLQHRQPKFPLAIDPKTKQFLLNGVIARSGDVEFYRLPSPRALPTFPHEYMSVDDLTGIITLHEEVVRQEYPTCIINSTENDGLQGSCALLKERVNISEEVKGHDGGQAVTLQEALDKWGDSLVIVASQELRFSALIGTSGDPCVTLSDLKFCLLEYVGRQRHHGVVQMDFAKAFKLTAASMYNYRKDLTDHRLLVSRMCSYGQSRASKYLVMLVLHRFSHMAIQSSTSLFMVTSNHVVDYLDQQPNKTADYKDVLAHLAKKFPSLAAREDWKIFFKRLYLELQDMKCVEVIHKAKSKQRVGALKLLKRPNKDDGGDEDEMAGSYDPNTCGLVAELPLKYQIYNVIEQMQQTPQGATMMNIQTKLNVDGHFIRRVMDKTFIREKVIKYIMIDEGRRRIRKFQTADFVPGETSTQSEAHGHCDDLNTAQAPQKDGSPKTATHMKRRQWILDMIQTNKVQDGICAMSKKIRQEERNEGRTVMVDKQTVKRLVEKLKNEGLCQKFSTVVMSDDGKLSRTVNFILDHDVKRDDPHIERIMQQVKFNLVSSAAAAQAEASSQQDSKSGKSRRKENARTRVTKYATLAHPSEGNQANTKHLQTSVHDTLCGITEGETQEPEKTDAAEKQPRWNKTVYGYLPKMERIRVLHKFMWYLVYGLPKNKTPQPVSDAIVIKQEIDEISTGQLEISWKTTDQSETPTDGDKSMLNETANLIGRQEMAMNSTNQSVKLSDTADPDLNQSGMVIGGMNTPSLSDMNQPANENLPKKNSLDSDENKTELPVPQTAMNLLESIESGIVSDHMTTLSTNPGPSFASATNHNPKPSQPLSNHNPQTYRVYLDVMDWRRFVQPLPVYKDVPEGWCLLADVFLSMPLVIFCKLVPPKFVIHGLTEVLRDPLRRLYLIKDQPLKLRRELLKGRCYLFNLEGTIDKMSSLGLSIYVSLAKEDKERLSTYICRNVTVLDTTSSGPGDFYVTNKTYPCHIHHLATSADVDRFWFDLRVICLDTPLSTMRNEETGKTACIRSNITGFARRAEGCMEPVIDDGNIPGDGRGAGGYHSTLFCHLQRNWGREVFNPSAMARERFHNRFQLKSSKLGRRLINPLKRWKGSVHAKKGSKRKEAITKETKLVDVEKHKAATVGGKGKKRFRASTPRSDGTVKIAQQKRKEDKKKAKEERKLHRRQKRDAGIITRTVFHWTPAEDNVLLLCKVASSVLNKGLTYKSFITWEMVQQIFHKYVPATTSNMKKKDALALSKRSTRLMRNEKYRMDYSVCHGEVTENKSLTDSAKAISSKMSNEAILGQFEALFNKLHAKFRVEEETYISLPDDLTTVHRDYKVVPIAKPDPTNKMFFKDENETDLKRLALHSIVLSTLASQMDCDYNPRLVFKLYEQYDKALLHDVFLFCRSKGIISRNNKNKNYNRRTVPCVPICYQLSQQYMRYFKKKTPHSLPNEAATCLKMLLDSDPQEGLTYPSVTNGGCSCQIIFLSSDQVNCKIIVPKQVIILDSNLIDKDYLEQSGVLKKGMDSSESESDTEEEESDEESGEERDGLGQGDLEGSELGIEMGDMRGVVMGGEQNTSGMMVEISFEDGDKENGDKEKVENEKSKSQTEDEQTQSDQQEDQFHEGNANIDNVGEGSAAMDMLNQLAGGGIPSMSSSSDVDGQSTSVGRFGKGSGRSAELAGDSSEARNGQKSSDIKSGTRLATDGSNQGIFPENVAAGSHSDSQDLSRTSVEPCAVTESPPQKSQVKNATMKCLTRSQSSFTKWLILQGHYAPGVCGTRISSLQENIAFNAFTLHFTKKLDELDVSCDFQPCFSLTEFLLRPCVGFNYWETLSNSSSFPKETQYLKNLFEGTFLKAQEGSIQELEKRLSTQGHDVAKSTVIVGVYERIVEAGFLGLMLQEVRGILGSLNAENRITVSVEKCVNVLVQEKMILEVGANALRLVATKHASLWTIHSQRLVSPHAQTDDSESRAKRLRSDTTKSRFSEEQDKVLEIIDLTDEPIQSPVESLTQTIMEQTAGMTQDDGEVMGLEGKGQPEVTDDMLDDDYEANLAEGRLSTGSHLGRAAKRKHGQVFQGVYEPVEFLPHPWRMANGQVNQREFAQMIRGIALQIIVEPGIKEKRLLDQFKDLFRRIDALKLLQIMTDLGIITRHCVTLPKPSLFNSVKSRSQSPVYYYHASINCLTKIGSLLEQEQTDNAT